ncbi:hypothetical protein EGD00_19970 [Pectobacterium carotovorum subsp. carotovorum]|nr:hypothetical protein EGD00_19970 [Pectobacterium carotovorum subsp. carotovorum]
MLNPRAEINSLYTRHTSSCMCVGRVRSPESLTSVSSSGLPCFPRYSALWPHPFGVSASAVQKRLAVFVLKLE